VKYSKATIDGTFHLGYDVTDNGDGTWHYEIAIFNMDSHRSARSFTVPIPQTVTLSNIEFRDIDYHSGEPVDNVDWNVSLDSCGLTFSTQQWSAGVDASANALRWSTMYNFRFDADSNQVAEFVNLGLFRPGTPSSVDISLVAPGPNGELGDPDHNGLHDLADFAAMQNCYPSAGGIAPECRVFDYDCSNSVDLADHAAFEADLGG
jgi:hypothetical protein